MDRRQLLISALVAGVTTACASGEDRSGSGAASSAVGGDPKEVEAEIDALVTAAITESGATTKAQMGAVMKLVSERAAGRADGKSLSQAVMKRLG